MHELTHKIRAILLEEDVEGLIALGAPADEYDSEAELIDRAVRTLGARCAEGAVMGAVVQVWNKMFGPFGPDDLAMREEALARVARRVAAAAGGHGHGSS